jgi:hypothetical protein
LNLAFNWVPSLDELQARGSNPTRTFSATRRGGPGSFGIPGNTLTLLAQRYACPRTRSSTAGVSDSGNKFDLSARMT